MVLVSNAHEFIFLKTTKTAGTSIEMALESYCAAPDHMVVEETSAKVSKYGIIGYRGSNPPKPRPSWKFWAPYPWRNHMPARRVRHNLGADRFDAFTKITAIRNPFDRLISQFFWLGKNQHYEDSNFDQTRDDFRAFALGDDWGNDFKIVSIKNETVIDEVIRFENMADDLRRLARKLDMDSNLINLPLTKSQKSKRKGRAISDFYDNEIIDHVRNRMAWVFERFDYSERPEDAGNPLTTEVVK